MHPNQGDLIAGDRREDRRYPIELQLKYRLIRRKRILETGAGRTVDLSSGGVQFETDRPLPVGLNVELFIDWPALLNNVAPMRLVAAGRIVRAAGNRSAMQTLQHEFRTQGVPAASHGTERGVLSVIPAAGAYSMSGRGAY